MVWKKTFTIGICFLLYYMPKVIAQNCNVASIVQEYKIDTSENKGKLELLYQLSFCETKDPEKSFKYAEALAQLSTKLGENKYLRRAYFLKGTSKRTEGKIAEAQEWYFKSADLAIAMTNIRAEGESYVGIGDAYAKANNELKTKVLH